MQWRSFHCARILTIETDITRNGTSLWEAQWAGKEAGKQAPQPYTILGTLGASLKCISTTTYTHQAHYNYSDQLGFSHHSPEFLPTWFCGMITWHDRESLVLGIGWFMMQIQRTTYQTNPKKSYSRLMHKLDNEPTNLSNLFDLIREVAGISNHTLGAGNLHISNTTYNGRTIKTSNAATVTACVERIQHMWQLCWGILWWLNIKVHAYCAHAPSTDVL